MVSTVVPAGSWLQKTGLDYLGKEKENRLMTHGAEHRYSRIVLP